jgi:hypothetical protein
VRWTITDAAIANANVFNSSSVDQNGTIYVCAANKLLALRSIDGSGTICSTKKAGRDAMKEEKEMQTRVVSAFCSGLPVVLRTSPDLWCTSTLSLHSSEPSFSPFPCHNTEPHSRISEAPPIPDPRSWQVPRGMEPSFSTGR